MRHEDWDDHHVDRGREGRQPRGLPNVAIQRRVGGVGVERGCDIESEPAEEEDIPSHGNTSASLGGRRASSTSQRRRVGIENNPCDNTEARSVIRSESLGAPIRRGERRTSDQRSGGVRGVGINPNYDIVDGKGREGTPSATAELQNRRRGGGRGQTSAAGMSRGRGRTRSLSSRGRNRGRGRGNTRTSGVRGTSNGAESRGRLLGGGIGGTRRRAHDTC